MSNQWVHVQGGSFLMGSTRHYPEERPERVAQVGDFFIQQFLVRNADFAAFVAATGYVTVAELKGHSHVFRMTENPVPLNNPDLWWKAEQGACWRNPRPGQVLPQDFQNHPVVHIALTDAKAYAAWCGGRLPTEAEWEYAAKGGLAAAANNTEFAWGNEFSPAGQRMAHVWQGAFPWYYALGSEPTTVTVGQFPANALGLFDMIGNVWEWTSGVADGDRRVIKGGSYLCAANYCARYRPAARQFQELGLGTDHIGVRLVDNRRAPQG